MEHLFDSLGPVTAVIGAQWGDEGKGKVFDLLTPHFDILARAGGGANAGHTIVVSGEKHVFHLLPAGSLHEGKRIILGSGMVIHLPTLLEEIRALQDAGIDVLPRLRISQAAHIVTEDHKKRDEALEESRSGGKLGTTRRGIGPAYSDKTSRIGIRMEALLGSVIPPEWKEAQALLRGCIGDAVSLLHQALKDGKRILIEGAQGTLLDIDHGTYPYVTSSSTTAAGALQGLGLPPRVLTSCIGVAKAYCTRVGGGPFPTEASEEDGKRLRERGGEYGATTGRPRRCGWLDLSDLRFAAALNGFTHLNLTKLDVLDEEENIPIFTEARHAEHVMESYVMLSLPASADESDGSKHEPRSMSQLKVHKLPGWKKSTRSVTSFDDLPENAKSYVRFIEEKVGVPISFIGTGPGREEMITRK